MGNSRPCFHVDIQTEYWRLQGHALYLVGPARHSVLCYELLKLTETITGDRIERNWCVWAEYWKTNGRNTMRDTIKWFCSMTMFDPMLRKWSRHTWKRWNGKFYYPPAVFSRRCSLWLSLISINGTRPGWLALPILWRSKKLDRFVYNLKRWPVFSTRDSYATRKMGESSGQRWTILWIILYINV